jgi:hypothetical protein
MLQILALQDVISYVLHIYFQYGKEIEKEKEEGCKSYCQMLCMRSLGSVPNFFNTIDKYYTPNDFCQFL